MGQGLQVYRANPVIWRIIILLALLVLGLVASCGGGGKLTTITDDNLQPDASTGFNLPAPAKLKMASYTASDLVCNGADYQNETGYPAQHLEVNYQNCKLQPGWSPDAPATADLAIACYAFDLEGYDQATTISFTWDTTGEYTDAWVGLANFADNTWDWCLLPDTNALLTNFDDLIDPATDTLLLALVITGSTEWELCQIQIGELVHLYGYVTQAGTGGMPVMNAEIKVAGEQTYLAYADSEGMWNAYNALPGDYTVSANLIGWEFDPASRNVTAGCGDCQVEEFVGTQLTTYPVSGYVFEQLNPTEPMPGVTVVISRTDTADGSIKAWTSASGEWQTELPNGDYTLTPELHGYQFAPAQAQLTVNNAPQTVNPFYGSHLPTYTISGYIFEDDGLTPLPGVQVNVYNDDGTYYASSDSFGYWSAQAFDGDYTVQPIEYGWGFTPQTREATVAGDNVLVDPFNGSPLQKYDLAGYVYLEDGVTPVAGATLQLSCGSGWYNTETNAAGFYFYENIYEGECTVAPTDPRYSFDPDDQTVTLDGDMQLPPFLATELPLYTVDGYVYKTDGITPIPGVTITVWTYIPAGLSFEGETDATGHYAVSGIPAGYFYVTPFRQGYSFDPAYANVEIADSDKTCTPFLGDCPQSYQLHGYVYELDGTTPVPDVRIIVTGSSYTYHEYTDATGHWSIPDAFEDSYSIIPSLAPWQFTPLNQNVEVHGGDALADPFLGEELTAYTVDGYVYELDTTIGVPDVELRFVNGEGLLYYTTTAADGHYQLPLPNDDWQVIPTDSGCWDFMPPYQNFTVADAPYTVPPFYAEPGG